MLRLHREVAFAKMALVSSKLRFSVHNIFQELQRLQREGSHVGLPISS